MKNRKIAVENLTFTWLPKRRDGDGNVIGGRCPNKGIPNRRIVAAASDDKRVYEYHATKGYRTRRKDD